MAIDYNYPKSARYMEKDIRSSFIIMSEGGDCMDWLKGMNDVIEHIEENLQEPIAYEKVARIVGCSVYEFFRIFSFMTGVSLAEYIRRRRLSQSVFDIQNSGEKIIDIALKYCYESPTSFAKAFKDLHGVTPSAARKTGVALKTFPPISFKLTIKGVEEMNFKIEKRGKFITVGEPTYVSIEDMQNFALPSIFSSAKADIPDGANYIDFEQPGEYEFDTPDGKVAVNIESDGGALYSRVAEDGKVYEMKVEVGVGDSLAQVHTSIDGESTAEQMGMYYCVSAFDFDTRGGKVKVTIVANMTDELATELAPYIYGEIPAATWAVFSFDSDLTSENVSRAYTRILSEWFPASGYARDEAMPHMESFPMGLGSENHPWEIWIPVMDK
jgi:AraC-like DNA-binding protein/predicted transcriptional regulator YdeE